MAAGVDVWQQLGDWNGTFHMYVDLTGSKRVSVDTGRADQGLLALIECARVCVYSARLTG